MSKEALNSFLKKVAEDSQLQGKLIEFAAKQGFEFTADELTEADLESISGGPNRRTEHFIAAELSKPAKIEPPSDINRITP